MEGREPSESPLGAATEHARWTEERRPAHASSNLGAPGCTRRGVVHCPPDESADYTCEAQPLWHRSGGPAAHRCQGSPIAGLLQRPRRRLEVHVGRGDGEGPVSSRRWQGPPHRPDVAPAAAPLCKGPRGGRRVRPPVAATLNRLSMSQQSTGGRRQCVSPAGEQRRRGPRLHALRRSAPRPLTEGRRPDGAQPLRPRSGGSAAHRCRGSRSRLGIRRPGRRAQGRSGDGRREGPVSLRPWQGPPSCRQQ